MLQGVNYFFGIIFLFVTTVVFADVTIPIYFTTKKGFGKPVGIIVISETPYGLLFTPHLYGLPPGIHGFHIHENPSCDQDGMAAGGHFDPKHTGKHLGPYNDHGHLGDLPALTVTADKAVTLPVLAPRIKHITEIKNHSIMIHAGGDNYSDEPMKLGGGGMRMICGVIQ